MFWLLSVILTPLIVLALLFFSTMEDFWQIVTLRLDLSRLFGDLIHVLFLLGVGAAAELFCLYMAIRALS